jgi:hypothetical protein
MTDQLIIRDNQSLSVSFSPQADALKAEALEKSALICRVRNDEENATAVEALKAIKAVRQNVEASRTAVKAPFLDACRNIDKTAKDFDVPLAEEEMRLGRFCGDYAALLLAKQKAEEAARIKALTEMEQRREAEKSQARSLEQIDAIQERYCQEAAALPVAKAPERPKGQVVKEDWDVEIVNDWLLAKTHPHCVTIKPKLSEIRLMLDNGLKVEGVKATRIVKSGVRVGRESEAISV